MKIKEPDNDSSQTTPNTPWPPVVPVSRQPPSCNLLSSSSDSDKPVMVMRKENEEDRCVGDKATQKGEKRAGKAKNAPLPLEAKKKR